MRPLGKLPLPFVGASMPRVACGIVGSGARLGSPPETPGVKDEVRIGATDEFVDESAAESGFVGFLMYAEELE